MQGAETIREEQSPARIKDRLRARARSYGLGFFERDSAYSENEQTGLARGDLFSKSVLRTSDLALGATNIGSMFLPSSGLATKLGIGSIVAGGAGLGSVSQMLGIGATFSNPYILAYMGAQKVFAEGLQGGVINPLVNTRQYTMSGFTGMKGVLGGQQSLTGMGGLSLGQSYQFARRVNNLERSNLDINPSTINEFVQAASEMPQLQYVTNSDQAIQNMEKFVTIMTKMARQFKGKEKDIIESFRQFGQMGMTLSQSEMAFSQANRMGTMLNVDPSKIMGAGYMGAQSMIGTGVSQATGYMMGSQNFILAERMRQAGQFSPTQLQNLGGTEGIANSFSQIQNRFLNNPISDIFLKSIYNRDTGLTGAGLNRDVLNQITSGRIGLGELKSLAQNVTLSSKANMQYQFDKESLISGLGDQSQAFVYESLNKMVANKNPWGNSLQGRARYLQSIGLADSNQDAMAFAQGWMAYNPELDAIRNSRQMDSIMGSFNPQYSSKSQLGRGLGHIGRQFSRLWEFGGSKGVFATFNKNTQQGNRFYNALWQGTKYMLGAENLLDNYGDFISNQDLDNLEPFRGIDTADDFLDVVNNKNLRSKVRSRDITDSIRSSEIGRLLSYGNPDALDNDLDRLAVNNIKENMAAETSKYDFSGSDSDRLSKVKRYATEYINKNGLQGNKFKVKNQDVTVDKIVQGIILENSLGRKEKERYFNSSLYKDKDLGEALVFDKVSNPYIAGSSMRANTMGFIMGNNMAIDDNNELALKFNKADAKTKENMWKKIDAIANAGEDAFDVNNTQEKSDLLGNANFETIVRFKELNKEKLNYLSDDSDAGKKKKKELADASKLKEVYKTVGEIYGNQTYKNLGSLYNNENVIESLVGKVLNLDNVDQKGLQVTEEDYRRMKKDFAGKPGLGDLMMATQYNKTTNMIEIKDGEENDVKMNEIKRNLWAATGRGMAELQITKASQVWDNGGRLNKASTIQDFAVAVAKGLQMYDGGKGKLSDKVLDSKDNPEGK